MKDIAVCTCHGLPAIPDQNKKQTFWICDINDKVCEIEFKEV